VKIVYVYLLPALAAVLIGGCKSPSAAFYTLSADAPAASMSAARPLSVVVGPVTIPDVVNRPQIVTRMEGNEVAVNEYARWAQPLKGEIARVIADDLAALLNTPQVSVFDGAADPLTAWHVRVDVMRFESMPGEDVTVDARWTVRPPGKGRAIYGRSVALEAVSGPGMGAVVAAHNRALATVSRDIAAAVEANSAP
jgi:uncharacterized lipoprotein YmbA